MSASPHQFDAELAPEAQLIRMLVRAEQTREAVFTGKILPDLLAPAPAWLESMIETLRQSGEEAARARRWPPRPRASATMARGRLPHSSGLPTATNGSARAG
jgi:protein involved in temperature-dependent protein secretion